MKAVPVSMSQILWNDNIQRPANRFLWRVAEKIGRRVVPNPDDSLWIRENDRIRSLINHDRNKLRLSVVDDTVLPQQKVVHDALLNNHQMACQLGWQAVWTQAGRSSLGRGTS